MTEHKGDTVPRRALGEATGRWVQTSPGRPPESGCRAQQRPVLEKPSRVGARGSRCECTRKRGRAASEVCGSPPGTQSQTNQTHKRGKEPLGPGRRWRSRKQAAREGCPLQVPCVLSQYREDTEDKIAEREGRSDESRKLTTGRVESHLEETEGLRREDSGPRRLTLLSTTGAQREHGGLPGLAELEATSKACGPHHSTKPGGMTP